MQRETLQLWILTIFILPRILWNAIKQQAFISIPLRTNPELELGGLPLASQLTRHGNSNYFIPTIRCSDEKLKEFISEHQHVVAKPAHGSQSRDVKVYRNPTHDQLQFCESYIVQPYIEGKEFTINIDRYGENVIYAITEIKPKGEVWTGSATYTTRNIKTDKLEQACRDVCDEIGLRFGRLDVKANSVEQLKNGTFHIMEVNGAFSVDLTAYTKLPLWERSHRLHEHWQRFFRAAAKSTKTASTPFFLFACLILFTISPSTASSFWNQMKHA